jgi:hypothetical protein
MILEGNRYQSTFFKKGESLSLGLGIRGVLNRQWTQLLNIASTAPPGKHSYTACGKTKIGLILVNARPIHRFTSDLANFSQLHRRLNFPTADAASVSNLVEVAPGNPIL